MPLVPVEPAHSPARYPLGPGSVSHIWALGDRVVIREDEFKSGYGCPRCNPSGADPGGRTTVTCPECAGTGKSTLNPAVRCKECRGDGHIPCPDCGGKGGSIIIAQESGRRPSSGTVVSAGTECKYLRPGDAVLFSNFAGYVVDLESASLRILHEVEILAGIEGHLTLAGTKYKTELATHSP